MSQADNNQTSSVFSISRKKFFIGLAAVLVLVAIVYGSITAFSERNRNADEPGIPGSKKSKDSTTAPESAATLDTAAYSQKLLAIANGDSSGRWPVQQAFPMPGAILPFNRIVAFYGNLYSKQMGILGELPRQEMLEKLKQEVAVWQKADTTTHVIPALHYIAVTAQGSPGKGGKYRLRMPFHQIDSVLSMAKEINALVFIDIQVGLSTLQEEIPQLDAYLKLPNVHLGIDPEFSMKGGQAPGKVIGTFDAADINYAIHHLADIAKTNNLPPKILVVHRFTQAMVTNYKQIKPQPEVQVVMDMDGWGIPAKKITTYKQFIYKEPVQFTGFKLFYKNDVKNNSRMLTPQEVLKQIPQPLYIQYQ
jgi:hypothetical protein